MPHADLVKEILTPLLNALDDRARTMIELRFGLTGYARTLEEIGDEYGLARERIRQLLRKGLDHLSAEAKPLLFNAIVQEAAELREALIEEHGVVRREDFPSRFDSPYTDLALAISELSSEDWNRLCVGGDLDTAN